MIVALNHKSNFTKDEILKYLEDYKNLNTYNHEMILIPSVCYLPLIGHIQEKLLQKPLNH